MKVEQLAAITIGACEAEGVDYMVTGSGSAQMAVTSRAL